MPDARIRPPQCSIKPSHFKVSSAAGYLKIGHRNRRSREQGPHPRARARRCCSRPCSRTARRRTRRRGTISGRIYLQQGELEPRRHARSPRPSSSRPTAPRTSTSIAGTPGSRWSRRAASSRRTRTSTPRLALYRQANSIYRGSPIRFYRRRRSGTTRVSRTAPPTTSARPRRPRPTPPIRPTVKYRNNSAFNQGVLLLNAKKYDQAAKVFEQYLKWVPNDAPGQARARGRLSRAGQGTTRPRRWRRRWWRRAARPAVARRPGRARPGPRT